MVTFEERLAVVAVHGKEEIEPAAEVWRETLEVIDRAARQVQALSRRYPGVHPSLDRILEIRHAASDMLALHLPDTSPNSSRASQPAVLRKRM